MPLLFRRLPLICLLFASPGVAVGQTPNPTVTTLPRPADEAPSVTPLSPSIQTIPPAAVLTQPSGLPPTTQSAAEEGLGRRLGGGLSVGFADVSLLFPKVNQNLNAPVNVGNLYTTTAQLPSAPLDFTAATTFHLRTPVSDLGEVGITYRLLASEGLAAVTGLDPGGVAVMRSRLDMHVIDLNYYATQDVGIWWGVRSLLDNTNWHPPRWGVNWDLGVRFASIYFDSQAVGPNLNRAVSNYYFGAGPRVGLSLTRGLGDSNLSFFGRIDSSAVLGSVQQRFSELAAPGGVPAAFGYSSQRVTQAAPSLTAQIGLTTTNPTARFGQWQIGYQYERWWMVGDAGPSTGDVILQGLFLRWTMNY